MSKLSLNDVDRYLKGDLTPRKKEKFKNKKKKNFTIQSKPVDE